MNGLLFFSIIHFRAISVKSPEISKNECKFWDNFSKSTPSFWALVNTWVQFWVVNGWVNFIFLAIHPYPKTNLESLPRGDDQQAVCAAELDLVKCTYSWESVNMDEWNDFILTTSDLREMVNLQFSITFLSFAYCIVIVDCLCQMISTVVSVRHVCA